MKKNTYIWNILLIFVLTAFALWFALKDNYEVVIQAIKNMSLFSLCVVLAWGVLYTVVWGCVYYVFGRKYVSNYRLHQGIIVAFVGSFFAGITPSSTGGQFGQAYIMKKQGIKVSDSVSLLWADFIIYQTTMMFYVTILFLLRYHYYSQQSGWFRIILLGYLINFIVIAVLYTVALFPRVYVRLSGWLAKLLGHLRFIKHPDKMIQSWTLQMTQFTSEVQSLSQDKKRIVICVLINFVRLSLLYSLPFVIGVALHIPLEMHQVIDVVTLSSFVLMANSFIPIPGASGGTEVVFSLLFQSMMGRLTGAVMVLWRFSSYHIILLIGGILFAIFNHRSSKKQEVS